MSQTTWNVLLLIGSLVAGGFAFVVFFWQKRESRKSISYDFEVTPLPELSEISSHLVLSFMGEAVSDVSVVSIKIKNTGKIPIRGEEFIKPITINIDGGRLLSASVIKVRPPEMSIPCGWNRVEPKITIVPILLNYEDEFTISAIVTGFRDLSCVCRIVGVKGIQRKPQKRLPIFRDNDILIVFASMVLPIIIVPIVVSITGIQISTMFGYVYPWTLMFLSMTGTAILIYKIRS